MKNLFNLLKMGYNLINNQFIVQKIHIIISVKAIKIYF